jgi:hypothetical protein
MAHAHIYVYLVCLIMVHAEFSVHLVSLIMAHNAYLLYLVCWFANWFWRDYIF